jgi:LacI family transcriptional regulator
VSVVCHDDQLRGLNATDLDTPITATQQSVKAAGRRLAEILIDLVECKVASSPVWEILPVDLVLRSSIGLADS